MAMPCTELDRLKVAATCLMLAPDTCIVELSGCFIRNPKAVEVYI